MKNQKERFSIRKFNVGVGSVLLGVFSSLVIIPNFSDNIQLTANATETISIYVEPVTEDGQSFYGKYKVAEKQAGSFYSIEIKNPIETDKGNYYFANTFEGNNSDTGTTPASGELVIKPIYNFISDEDSNVDLTVKPVDIKLENNVALTENKILEILNARENGTKRYTRIEFTDNKTRVGSNGHKETYNVKAFWSDVMNHGDSHDAVTVNAVWGNATILPVSVNPENTNKNLYVKELSENGSNSISGNGTKELPYNNLKTALEQAKDGDTIVLLSTAVWSSERPLVIDKKINIVSENDKQTLTIRGTNINIYKSVNFNNINIAMLRDGTKEQTIDIVGINEEGVTVKFDRVTNSISEGQSNEKPNLFLNNANLDVKNSDLKLKVTTISSDKKVDINLGNTLSDELKILNLGAASNLSVDNAPLVNYEIENQNNATIAVKNSYNGNININKNNRGTKLKLGTNNTDLVMNNLVASLVELVAPKTIISKKVDVDRLESNSNVNLSLPLAESVLTANSLENVTVKFRETRDELQNNLGKIIFNAPIQPTLDTTNYYFKMSGVSGILSEGVKVNPAINIELINLKENNEVPTEDEIDDYLLNTLENVTFIDENYNSYINAINNSGKLANNRLATQEEAAIVVEKTSDGIVTTIKYFVKQKNNEEEYTTVEKIKTEDIPFITNYVSDDNLDFGKRVVVDGVTGTKQTTTVYKIINGQLTSEIVGTPVVEIIKDAVNRIVTVGTKPKETREEIAYDTKYIADETKEYGYREEVAGVTGAKITRIIYKLNEKTGEVTSTETIEMVEAKNKIVTVGTKPKVTTEIIPSEEIIEKDPNEYEDYSITKEGAAGVKTIKHIYTVDSKTGKITETTEVTITKEATPSVKRVGIKPIKRTEIVTKELPPVYVGDDEREVNTGEVVDKNGSPQEIENTYEKDVLVSEKVLKKGKPKIIKVGTKPKTVIEKIPSMVIEKSGYDIIPGVDGEKEVSITYQLNPSTGKVIEIREEKILKEPTEPIISKVSEETPIVDLPIAPIDKVPEEAPIVDLPIAPIDKVPEEAPIVDLPIAPTDKVSEEAPIVDLPIAPTDKVPEEAPIVDLPIAPTDKVPEEAPIVDLPIAPTDKVPEEAPTVDLPVVEFPQNKVTKQKQLPNTGNEATNTSILGTLSMLLSVYIFRKNKSNL